MSWVCTWLKPSFTLYSSVLDEYIVPPAVRRPVVVLQKKTVSASCPSGEKDLT